MPDTSISPNFHRFPHIPLGSGMIKGIWFANFDYDENAHVGWIIFLLNMYQVNSCENVFKYLLRIKYK
jgi:hypothetical protein